MKKYAHNIVAKKLLVLLLAVTIPLTGVSCQKTPEQPAAEAVETAGAAETAKADEAAKAGEADEAAKADETAKAGEADEAAKAAETAESTADAEAIVHGEVTLQEMIDSYHSVDPDALKTQIGMLEKYYQENSEDKNPEETVVKIYKEICAVYEEQQQQRAISEILSFIDTSDSEMAEKSARDASNLLLLQNDGRSAIRNALNGPYGEALRKVIDPNQIHVYFDTVDFTPEMEELAGQYTSIVSKYHLAMSQPVTCEFDGVTYASNGELPEENRDEIIKQLCKAREEIITPIYVDLINNRNEFARLLGYDNFLEYSYAQEFNRDYTPEDVKAMLDNIYEFCAPLLQSAGDSIGDASLQKSLGMSSEEMLELLDENIEKVSPELDESLDYMMKYKLYSLGNEPNRIHASMMEPIPAIRAGCIFAGSSDTLGNYVNLTHEFGHFNNAYQVYSPALAHIDNLDILEVHSQGLELLMSDSLKSIAPVENGDYSAAITMNKLRVILVAVMVGRFEIECFEHPEMDAAQMRETIDRFASGVMEGAEELSDVSSRTSWTQINHLFDAPLYYISYATSALSALDVYSEYLKDPQAGWDKYIALTHINPEMKYVEAVSACGLHDMTKEEDIREVMETLASHYKEENEKQ